MKLQNFVLIVCLQYVFGSVTVFADELGAFELLNKLLSGKPALIDSTGEFGHTIRPLSKGEAIMLNELSVSTVSVSRLTNILSSRINPESDFTLGACARFILTWHDTGRYPLNVEKQPNK